MQYFKLFINVKVALKEYHKKFLTNSPYNCPFMDYDNIMRFCRVPNNIMNLFRGGTTYLAKCGWGHEIVDTWWGFNSLLHPIAPGH